VAHAVRPRHITDQALSTGDVLAKVRRWKDDHLVDKRREGRDPGRDHECIPSFFLAQGTLQLGAMHSTAPLLGQLSWNWPLETYGFDLAESQCQHNRSPS
jgi:hypothetical protein